MGRFGLGAAMAALLLSTTAQAQDGEVRNFTMSGPWSLDAGDDYCRLAANFTNGGDTIAFALERIEPGVQSQLILIGDAITPFRGTDVMGYAFQPNGEMGEARFLMSETADGQAFFNLRTVVLPGVYGSPTPPPPEPGVPFVPPPYQRDTELTAASAINALALGEGLRQPVHIQLGPMRAPIAALQSCTDDLLRIWGLDYVAHRTMTRSAAPDGAPVEWAAGHNLGPEDMRYLSYGQNSFRVMVSAEGRATACVVQSPSLPEERNAAICAAMITNGRFTPALDAAGSAMASYWMAPFMTFGPQMRQIRR